MTKKIITIQCQRRLYKVDIKDFSDIKHINKKSLPSTPIYFK